MAEGFRGAVGAGEDSSGWEGDAWGGEMQAKPWNGNSPAVPSAGMGAQPAGHRSGASQKWSLLARDSLATSSVNNRQLLVGFLSTRVRAEVWQGPEDSQSTLEFWGRRNKLQHKLTSNNDVCFATCSQPSRVARLRHKEGWKWPKWAFIPDQKTSGRLDETCSGCGLLQSKLEASLEASRGDCWGWWLRPGLCVRSRDICVAVVLYFLLIFYLKLTWSPAGDAQVSALLLFTPGGDQVHPGERPHRARHQAGRVLRAPPEAREVG